MSAGVLGVPVSAFWAFVVWYRKVASTGVNGARAQPTAVTGPVFRIVANAVTVVGVVPACAVRSVGRTAPASVVTTVFRSNAPMSQMAVGSAPPSTGRWNPRWSVAGHPTLVPASMAGLPGSSAWVSVGPPLFWSGPSSGLVAFRSPGPAKAQVASLLRLWPRDVTE